VIAILEATAPMILSGFFLFLRRELCALSASAGLDVSHPIENMMVLFDRKLNRSVIIIATSKSEIKRV